MSRFTRLAVASGLALAATAPMTSSANAFMCSPEAEVVCWTYGTACANFPNPEKFAVYKLLCESFG